MADHQRAWQVFIENREAVIAALERGECAGILPAARGFLESLQDFCWKLVCWRLSRDFRTIASGGRFLSSLL